ncbi:fungal-specific transcription factor domain-containing protein [Suillus ampliporus]|nr:fungal-specific transcription factor domain-containing protein [Suillus ampliporus]
MPRSRSSSIDSFTSSSSSSSSASDTMSSTMSHYSYNPPRVSKREYLLAQIRHKDQIIESLLKQLHNPYLATPLSVASYKAATSPSDSDNMNVVDWLDRLQASIRQPGMAPPTDPDFLRNLRNPSAVAVDDSEEDDPDADEGPVEEEDTEKTREKGRGRQGGNTGASGSTVKPEDDDDNVGVANKEYFLPGPASNLNIRKTLVEQHTPEIVLHGLVNNADVEKLFDIYWKQINPFIGLLDPTLHTSQSIFQRCPFLFTVICAISSRYYKDKSEIYPVAMHFAKHSAANALIDGWKSVELCQAYILMSIYAVPARKWEEDRSWLYTGLAARIATDLNLHQVSTTRPQTERQEREMLNRTRVWMICFNIDRSTATQFGKPTTIKEDYITRHSADWYKQSRYRDKFDIHLCAYSTLLRIVGRFHDDIFSDPNSPTGLNKGINFLQVTLEHDRHLTNYFEEWTRRFNEESDPGDPGSLFRCTLLPFLVSYSRLVMYSFGFQHAFQRGMEASDNVFLDKCFDSAKVVIKQMIEVLAPSGLMCSAPDGHFVFASFASAFMLKLLRPEFAQLLTRQMEDEIFELIGRLITTLQDVAIDERHTPRLYARFLASLLTRHRKGGGAVGGRLQHVPPQSQVSRQPQPRNFASQSSLPSSGSGYSGLPGPGMSQQGRDNDSMQMTLNQGTPSSSSQAATPPSGPPMMHSEAAYSHAQPTNGVLDSDVDVGMVDVLSESGTLAAMHAINDAWWGNMMMPGYVFFLRFSATLTNLFNFEGSPGRRDHI